MVRYFHSQLIYAEEFLPQNEEPLCVEESQTESGEEWPSGDGLVQPSAQEGSPTAGLLRTVSSQVLTTSKDGDSTLITRLYVEHEGGSSLLHEVGPKNKRERKS